MSINPKVEKNMHTITIITEEKIINQLNIIIHGYNRDINCPKIIKISESKLIDKTHHL